MLKSDTRIPILSSADIVTARQKGRSLAMELGFDSTEITLIAAAISEVSRNIVEHAKRGEIFLRRLRRNGHVGLSIVACDKGPGISDVPLAMQYGYSSRDGLGVGLPGAKWLVDEFDIQSEVGVGTTVTMKKWTHK